MPEVTTVFGELVSLLGITRKEGEETQDFLKRLCEKVDDVSEEDWEQLTTAAQSWVNKAMPAIEQGEAIPIPPGMSVEPKASSKVASEKPNGETKAAPEAKSDTKEDAVANTKVQKTASAPKGDKSKKAKKPKASEVKKPKAAPAKPISRGVVVKKTKTKVAAKGKSAAKTKHEVRPDTKLSLLIEMLGRKEGATMAELVKALKWESKSVHGAISGTLRNKMGKTVAQNVETRGRVYRITAGKTK